MHFSYSVKKGFDGRGIIIVIHILINNAFKFQTLLKAIGERSNYFYRNVLESVYFYLVEIISRGVVILPVLFLFQLIRLHIFTRLTLDVIPVNARHDIVILSRRFNRYA